MRHSYILTYKDYLEAQRLYRRSRWTAALSYYVWIWCLPIVGGLFAILSVVDFFSSRRHLTPALAACSAAGLWFACMIPATRIYTPRKCWHRLLPETSQKSIRTTIPVELEMTPEQLISTLPGSSEGRFFWPSLVAFSENENLALVFVKKRLFLFIPKQALDEPSWAELRSHFQSKVGGPKC